VSRLLPIVVLATALLMPATASAAGARPQHARRAALARGSAHTLAHGRLASSNPVVVATAVAERYWGAVPCDGHIEVRANQALPAGLSSSVDGWATFNSSLGPNNLEAPASTYTQCGISLAHWQWPTRAEIERDWNMFCLTVVHEMGHLLGHPHSLVPGSVMAPEFTGESNVPAICRSVRAQAGATHS
jgi:hypothetical protein